MAEAPLRPSFVDSVRPYLDGGWTLLPLRPGLKEPAGKWDDIEIKPSDISKAELHYDTGGNFALLLAKSNANDRRRLMVVDVDTKGGKKGAESYEKLRAAFPDLPRPHVRTPSGGHHTYLVLKTAVKMPLNSKDYPDIDFLSGNRYAVIPGSVNADGVPYEALRPLTTDAPPANFIETLTRKKAKSDKKKPTAGLMERVAVDKMMDGIDASQFDGDRDGWLRVGMALHSEDDGASMREVWLDWSRRSKKYAADPNLLTTIEREWASFKQDGGITINYAQRLLLEGLRKRYVLVRGGRGDTLYDLRLRSSLSKSAFDLIWGRIFNKPLSEMALGASNHAADDLVTVIGTMCAPGHPDVFEFDGNIYANEWGPECMPKPAAEASVEAREQFAFFDNHLRALCPDEVSHSALRRWLAHQIKHPGRKIGWSPVIMGVQGSGKTMVVLLLRSLMGGRNVKPARTESAVSQFNASMIGAPVVSLGDFSLNFRQKRDFNEAMKELITDRVIEKHAKNQTAVPVLNMTNYILCTNSADALVMDDNERRWFVVSRGYANLGEFVQAAMGYLESASPDQINNYYFRLAQIVDEDNPLAPELRRLFLDMEGVDDLLKDHPRAPTSGMKLDMAANSRSAAERLTGELLSEGGRNEHGAWGDNALVPRALLIAVNKALEEEGDDDGIKPKTLGYILRNRFWVEAGRPDITGLGRVRLMKRGTMTNKEAADAVEAMLGAKPAETTAPYNDGGDPDIPF